MIQKQTAEVYYSTNTKRRFIHLKSAIRAEARMKAVEYEKHLDIPCFEWKGFMKTAIEEVREEHRINECYQAFDKRMSYREDKLLIAQKHGYNFISQAIEQMYYDDFTVVEIAKIFGINRNALYVIMRRVGVIMNKRGRGRQCG